MSLRPSLGTWRVVYAQRVRFGRLPGVKGIIGKPFDPTTLHLRLAELVEWSRK
jgi:hypothetical protein